MKKHRRPKRLTSKQKKFLSRKGFDPTEYLLVEEWEGGLLIINKENGETVEVRNGH